MTIDAEQWGWRQDLADALAPGEELARVAAVHGIAAQLWTREGVRYGPLGADLGEPPAVGDLVAARRSDGAEWPVLRLLPRRTAFVRHAAGNATRPQVIAANIDRVFVATSADADFNPRRLVRYLLALATSGARATLVLTKADACADLAPLRAEAERMAETMVVSVRTGEGLAALRACIGPGVTAALVGSSGVGKSTLVNALTGAARAAIGEVRAFDGKGRHTTTHRELFALDGGGVLVDTPGMRALEPWADEGTRAALDALFAEVSAAAAGCAFDDCAHGGVAGCAVRAGVDAGALDADRVRSWTALHAELDAQEALRAERAEKVRGRRR